MTSRTSPDVSDRFSTRSKDIKGKEAEYDQSAKEKGTRGMDAKARAKLSLYDRPPKVGNGTREDMHREWVGKLDDFEMHGLRNAVRKAREVVRREQEAEYDKVAYYRRRDFQEQHHEPERARGRSR